MENSKQAAFAKSAFYHPDGGVDSPQEGLTKREYASMLALQGILANPNFNGGEELSTVYEKCESAIAHADELLKQLEK